MSDQLVNVSYRIVSVWFIRSTACCTLLVGLQKCAVVVNVVYEVQLLGELYW